MKVRLWLWYVPGTTEQISEACQVAEQELASRDVAITTAFAATVAANDLDDSAADTDWGSTLAAEGTGAGSSQVDGPAVAAWYAAEFAALTRLSELTGEWPSQGSLIVIEE